MRGDPGDIGGIESTSVATDSFTFFGIRKPRDNDTFRAKRRTLLDDLKRDVKRLMEEAATKNSLPENCSLVLSFCVNTEACLRFGLRNCSPHFYREPSVVELLQKISPKCPEASVLLGYLTCGSEKTKSTSTDKATATNNRSFLSTILYPNKPTQSTGAKPQCYNSSTNPHWIHLALMEKLLQPVVCALFNEGKTYYQYGAIMTTKSDARIFMSLLSGPCSLNYTIPTVDDPNWSSLNADELIERHRFISLSTQNFYDNQTRSVAWKKEFKLRTNSPIGVKPIGSGHSSGARSVERSPVHPIGPRFVFGLQQQQQHSSTSSNSSAASGGMDSLYQPRRHQLLYAKNNVMLGDTRSHLGYLAVYCNLSGVNLRWTSNELLLHASSLLHRVTQSEDFPNPDNHSKVFTAACHETTRSLEDPVRMDEDRQRLERCKSCPATDTSTNKCNKQQDEQSHTNFRERCRYSQSTSPMLPFCLNIALKDIDYIHCHSENSGVLMVFVASDGIQYPPIRLPGGWKSSLDLLSSLELGLTPSVQLEPSTSTVQGLIATMGEQLVGSGMTFGKRLQSRSATDASPGPPNPFKRLIHFCSLRSTPITAETQTLPSPANTVVSTSETDQNSPAVELIDDANSSRREPVTNDSRLPIGENEDNSGYDDSKQPARIQLSTELVFKLIRNEVSPDPFSDKPNEGEFLEPTESVQNSKRKNPDDSMESLSEAIDAIKCKLMANAFYTWLTHSRYMKVVKTHLADSVRPGSTWPQTPTSPITPLTASKWNQLFGQLPEECRVDFDATPIYEHIYQAGCDHELRLQVWPYIFQVYDWSMTEEQKQKRLVQLQEHYQTKLKEWVELEELIKRGHPDGSDSLSTSLEEDSQIPSKDCLETGNQQNIRKEFVRVLESVQKDVIRCDRNHRFFHKVGDHGSTNLAILRRVLVTYVWEHLEDGYTQGMCDLIAPLLALLLTTNQTQAEIEVQTYVLFVSLMKVRLGKLYCSTTSSMQMDRNFASLRALVQVMDPELNGHIQMYGDFTHFYFCYRWFLLDFKREFKYEDVFRVWETLLAASHLISDRFELFVALALIQCYRDVIISAQMEFTDILKFFNERAEKHSVEYILDLARKNASQIQDLLKTA